MTKSFAWAERIRSDEIVCACDNSGMVQTTISPCDVLIIGAGVMGMLSALELAEAGSECCDT